MTKDSKLLFNVLIDYVNSLIKFSIEPKLTMVHH